jgi:multiple sugar transport system substrate-binding protein
MSQLSRRRLLKYLGVAGIGALAAGVVGYEALAGKLSPDSTSSTTQTSTYVPPANSTPDYAEFMTWLSSVSKPFAGRSLDISLENEFASLGIQQLDLDFLNATMINDQYNLKPYDLHLQDISLMARTKASTYDLFSVDYQDVGSFYDLVLSPSELADKYPGLTYQSLNPNDFYNIPWSYCSTYPPAPYQSNTTSTTNNGGSGGDVLFIPFDMSTMIQFYRQDLYQQAGISVASNWTEYINAAKSLTKSKVPFGTVNETTPDISSVFEFMNFLSSYGGNLWNINGANIVSSLDSQAALSALETYVSLHPYSDPASYTYNWENISVDLLHNVASTALEFQGFEAYMNDPQRSFVVDKVAYAQNPAGSAGAFSLYGGSGLGVSKYSKNPEAAWLWLQWATATGTQEMNLLGYFRAFPSRKGVFSDSTIQQSMRDSSFSAANITKQVWDSGSVATLLPFPKWLDVVGDIGYGINQAWTGNLTPQNAISTAIQKIQSWGSLTF